MKWLQVLILAAIVLLLFSMELPLTLERTRPILQVIAVILSGFALFSAAQVVLRLAQRPGYFALEASIRMIRWPWLAASAAIMAFLMVASWRGEGFLGLEVWQIVEVVIPLIVGMQAALAFSPDDEEALEVMLACPRGIVWILLERLAMIFAAQGLLAVVGMIMVKVIVPDADLAQLLIRWLPGMVFFSAVGVFLTIRGRMSAFGMAIAGALWFASLLFVDVFTPQAILPYAVIERIQPFLWSLNVYIDPADLSSADYGLNRLIVMMAGIALLAISAYSLRDEEEVLTAARKGK